jgi:hypothetical protein
MIARFLGVRVWELPQVAAHYIDEAAIILEAQHEARLHLTGKGASGLAGAATVALREF